MKTLVDFQGEDGCKPMSTFLYHIVRNQHSLVVMMHWIKNYITFLFVPFSQIPLFIPATSHWNPDIPTLLVIQQCISSLTGPHFPFKVCMNNKKVSLATFKQHIHEILWNGNSSIIQHDCKCCKMCKPKWQRELYTVVSDKCSMQYTGFSCSTYPMLSGIK